MGDQALQESFRELNASFVRLLDSLSALSELSLLEVRDRDEVDFLREVLGVLLRNHDLERCSVFLRRGEQLVNVAGLDWEDVLRERCGEAHASRDGGVFRLGEGMVGLAAQTRRLQRCNNCEVDARFLARAEGDGGGRPAPSCDGGSIIAAPIEGGGELLGVLNVSHPEADFFGEAHERALQIFANFLGQLLLNNRLMRAMDDLVGQRTLELQEALSDAQRLKQRYQKLSYIDELTGLHNRRFFFGEVEAALGRALRYGTPFSLLLVDIDYFKQINDTHGHVVGDRVLAEIARRVQQCTRSGDIVARFGGEEFAVALPGAELVGAKLLAERICDSIRGLTWEVEGKSLALTVSIGVSCRTGRGSGTGEEQSQVLEELLQQADQALYFGKQHGRDQYQVFQEIACQL